MIKKELKRPNLNLLNQRSAKAGPVVKFFINVTINKIKIEIKKYTLSYRDNVRLNKKSIKQKKNTMLKRTKKTDNSVDQIKPKNFVFGMQRIIGQVINQQNFFNNVTEIGIRKFRPFMVYLILHNNIFIISYKKWF